MLSVTYCDGEIKSIIKTVKRDTDHILKTGGIRGKEANAKPTAA